LVFVLIIAVALGILLFANLIGRLKQSQPATEAQIFIFGVLPTVLSAIGSVIELPKELQILTIQGVFLILVCILPAIMWYLFVVTRKASGSALTLVSRGGLFR
jgi:hypothetical protein